MKNLRNATNDKVWPFYAHDNNSAKKTSRIEQRQHETVYAVINKSMRPTAANSDAIQYSKRRIAL